MEHTGPLRLVGLDVDRLETALAEKSGVYDRVYTTPADRIPEPDASFDFVVSVSVMEHIPNLENVLREVSRVLKPGGQLIASVPSVGFHRCLRGPLLPWVERDQYLRSVDRRVAHLRYWTAAEWHSALSTAGMRLVKAKPILSRSEIRRWEMIARTTAGVLFVLTRGKPPIQIQRSLGMRKAGQHLPRGIATTVARLLALGVRSEQPSSEEESGCLLVIATRD
jgi:SAM-dependent methyltransferase